jgi:hypothetical protein
MGSMLIVLPKPKGKTMKCKECKGRGCPECEDMDMEIDMGDDEEGLDIEKDDEEMEEEDDISMEDISLEDAMMGMDEEDDESESSGILQALKDEDEIGFEESLRKLFDKWSAESK